MDARRIRVTLKAYIMPKSKTNPDYVITRVRYVVSANPKFTDKIVRNVSKTPTDEKMMEYSFFYDFPDEEVLFGYVEYTYLNGEIERSTTCRLTYKQPGFSFNNNIIATPSLSLKSGMDTDIVPLKNIELVLSEFTMFQGHGVLDSTTWKIFNSNDELILHRERDTFNTTSFVIPDDLLESNKMYRAEAIYFNNYDSESYPAVLILNTAGNQNTLSLDSSSINIVSNGISSFIIDCNFINFKHLKTEILNSEGDYVLTDFISKSKKVSIPKIGFEVGERYYFRVSAIYTNNRGEEEVSKPIEFSSVCKSMGDGKEYDINYKYNNYISAINYDLKNIYIEKLGGYSEQLPNGDIPIHRVSGNAIEIKYFKFFSETLVDTNRGFKLITNSNILADSDVNIKLVIDLIKNESRLIVAYNLENNKVEVKSYLYKTGELGNVDLNILPNSLIIDNCKLLANSTPIIDFKDDEFLLGLIPMLDNKNIVVLKKDLSNYSYISNLYQPTSIPGNSTSIFRLPDNKILKVSSDATTQRYGTYDIRDNNFVDKGVLPNEMQNIFGNINGNRWYGFDRKDGNTLLIPRFSTIEKFNVYLYNYYENTINKIIKKEDIIIPGKYQNGLSTTIERIYSIELLDGTLLLIMSGNKNNIDFKDIWKYS